MIEHTARRSTARRALFTVVVLATIAGCASDEDRGAAPRATPSASNRSDTTIATSTTGSRSTTTTPAPTTSEESDPVDGLVLQADGIGPVGFGASEAETLAALDAGLGAVTSETSNTYAIDRGDGTFLDRESGEVFTHPAQRTMCFDNALCVVFGGSAEDSLTLVGWVQREQGISPPLSTIDGVTVGSSWADHVDDLVVRESGCYAIGYGTTRGIDVVLSSVGDPFLAYDDDGNDTPTGPDPTDVVVIELSAGPRPGNPEEQDC